MNARELRSCLVLLVIAVFVTVHIQLFAVFYVSTDANGKSPASHRHRYLVLLSTQCAGCAAVARCLSV